MTPPSTRGFRQLRPALQPGSQLMDTTTEVGRAARAVARADEKAAAARERLAAAVRAALAEQVSTAELMRLTGLSRGRIYQIRDGRR